MTRFRRVGGLRCLVTSWGGAFFVSVRILDKGTTSMWGVPTSLSGGSQLGTLELCLSTRICLLWKWRPQLLYWIGYPPAAVEEMFTKTTLYVFFPARLKQDGYVNQSGNTPKPSLVCDGFSFLEKKLGVFFLVYMMLWGGGRIWAPASNIERPDHREYYVCT